VAGIAKAQIGNLVGPGLVEELTTVSAVDPIRVYIPMTEQEYMKGLQNGHFRTQQGQLELILADGSIHPHKGAIASTDRQVDERTGTIKVAAFFPNPGNLLRPGQFARVRAQTMVRKGALLVPQRAVTELQGSYQVAVVGPDNKIDIRPVKVAERVGGLWVVDQGLKPGEKVVVEGVQKARQGVSVNPKPFAPEASPTSEAKPPAQPSAPPKGEEAPAAPARAEKR
jgi:membrane fusion protein (multidrug efflux system)